MDERVQRARLALQRGYTVTAAAAYAGVSRRQLYDWMASKDFGDGLCKARARGQQALERSVLRDAKKDGRLALEVLSRRCRAWQRKDHLNVDAKVKDTSEDDPRVRLARLKSLAAAIESGLKETT